MAKTNHNKVVIIGCGNLAWHLAKKFTSLNKFSVEIYNHKSNSALKNFKSELKCNVHQNINKIDTKALYYFVCVNDKSIKSVSLQIKNIDKNAIVVHMSGNAGVNKLQNNSGIKGVIYPLQTFSKNDEVSWKELPLFIESYQQKNLSKIKSLANLLSKNVVVLNSADRAKLHLMAVFVNNFTNALYVAAANYLKTDLKNLNFKLLLPLIEQTTLKLKNITPQEAQTGPVKRGDKQVVKEHLRLLKQHKDLKKLYKQFSNIIQKQ